MKPLRPTQRRVLYLVVLLWLVWLIGQLTDGENRVAEWLTYIPSAGLGGMVLLVGLCWMRKDRRLAVGLVCLSLAPIVVSLQIENPRWYKYAPGAPAPGSYRMIHWNVARGVMGWERIAEALRRDSADLVALSEVNPDELSSISAALHSTNTSSIIHGRYALFGRGQIGMTHELPTPVADVSVVAAGWKIDGHDLLVFVVDLASALNIPRH
ncbi:MAG: hypothetical protein O3A51_10045, partial [Verrucomicrobia bacterium]|nr:hypothetical protein [Verrucomicrobiota bacterium]